MRSSKEEENSFDHLRDVVSEGKSSFAFGISSTCQKFIEMFSDRFRAAHSSVVIAAVFTLFSFTAIFSFLSIFIVESAVWKAAAVYAAKILPTSSSANWFAFSAPKCSPTTKLPSTNGLQSKSTISTPNSSTKSKLWTTNESKFSAKSKLQARSKLRSTTNSFCASRTAQSI